MAAPPRVTPSSSAPAELALEPIILAVGDDISASWSPDGHHLLVRNSVVNRPSAEQAMEIVSRDGTVVHSFAGADEGYWLDAERFLLKSWHRIPTGPGRDDPWVVDYSGCHDVEPNGVWYLGTLASDQLADVELSQCRPLPSGHGALAFYAALPKGSDCAAPCAAFTVWDGETLTEPRPGYPAAWSADGTMLAVVHTVETRIGIEGRPEVLTWPALQSVASDREHTTGETSPDFDPAGRYLAYNSYGQNKLMELATGNVGDVGPAEASGAAWDDQGRLVVIGSSDGSARAISASGHVETEWQGLGNVIVGSGDGSTLLAYDIDAEPPHAVLNVIRGRKVKALRLPGRIDRRPEIAGDGSAFTIEALVGGRWTLLLYRLNQ